MSRKAKILVPLAVLAVGLAMFLVLLATRPRPRKRALEERVVPVEVVVARRASAPSLIEARGQIQAARSVDLEPEVTGRIVWLAANFVPGGRFRRGETLLRIDPTDYRLAVEGLRGEVSQAELQLRQERNRRDVSERAWARYRARTGRKADEADPALALNLPQVRAAERNLQSARSRLHRAEVDLARTTLSAPFDATVVQEQVALGQRVGPGQVVATLVDTDRYWVNVSVHVDDVHLVDVPGEAGTGVGSLARVTYTSRGGRTERQGRVLRLVDELEADGSMARLLVEVADPLGLAGDPAGSAKRGPPLLLGAFVDVILEGRMLEGVFVLPEEVLHQEDVLWVVGPDDRLERRRVDVLRLQQGTVVVADGLVSGERVVRSHLPLAVAGTKVAVQERRAEEGTEAPGADPP